jgi:hypothetical protein
MGMGMNMQPRIQTGDGVAFAEIGDVLLMAWSAPARIDRARFVTGCLKTSLRATTGSLILVQLILPSSSPPDAPTRAEAAHQIAIVGHRLRRLVTVPLGDGMWTILVRMIMRGIALFQKFSGASVVVDDVDEALHQINLVRRPTTPTGAELRALFTQLLCTVSSDPPVTIAAAQRA